MIPVKRTFVMSAIGLVLLAATATAQVTFAGDARFRPRLDLDDRTEDPNPNVAFKSSALYYMYRLRLDMTAAIGEGYYVRSRLGHNGVAYYSHGGSGDLPDLRGGGNNTVSEETARRSGVDFMYMYIGRSTPKFGFDLGLIPIPGFVNPLWDLHYYPDQMVDIPYLIWNNDGGFGAHAYVVAGPGRLTVHGLLDRDRSLNRENAEGVTDRDNDSQYTLAASYALPIGPVTFTPTVKKTFLAGLDVRTPTGQPIPAQSGVFNSPLTVGAQLALPAVGPFTPAIFGGWTQSNVESIDTPQPEYDGWLGRFRLSGRVGPGTLTGWADVARRTDAPFGARTTDLTTNYFHTWLNYRIPVYTSERGSFSINPEWRMINVSRDDLTLRRRHKIEIDFDVTFR